MKPIAPLGEYLVKEIKYNGYKGSVVVFMGERAQIIATKLHPFVPSTLYLPPFTSPYHFRWPVLDCGVYLVDTGNSKFSFIRYCALCFFSYGAKFVYFQSRNKDFNFEKGFSYEHK